MKREHEDDASAKSLAPAASAAAGQPMTASVTCGEFTFTGASISAHTTFIFCRQLNVIFDIGSVVEEMLPLDYALVSHTHQDHLLGLTRYVGLRRLQHMPPPTVIVPTWAQVGVRKLFEVWQELESDGLRQPPEFNLLPAQPGQEIPLAGNLVARTFAVVHALPSLGYVVLKRTQKLKPEFAGRPGHELAELRRLGVQITEPRDAPYVTYIGDTHPDTLDRLTEGELSPIIIVECTFLTEEHFPLAASRGHLHIRHLIGRLDRLGDAQIILTHFSRRYSRRDIEMLVSRQWPRSEAHRLHMLI